MDEDVTLPDTDAIEEALAHLFAARDCLYPAALRARQRETETFMLRQKRQSRRETLHAVDPLLVQRAYAD